MSHPGALAMRRTYLDDMYQSTIGQAAARRQFGCSVTIQILRQTMRLRIFVISLLLTVFSDAAAQAHALLDHANPPVGSTVASAPQEVTLTFTQNLEPAFSSVQVTAADGARVDQDKAQISGNTMRVGLKSLAAGSYRVRWQALSVDTHKTEGSFTFSVGGR
jgi:copper resistance protein C